MVFPNGELLTLMYIKEICDVKILFIKAIKALKKLDFLLYFDRGPTLKMSAAYYKKILKWLNLGKLSGTLKFLVDNQAWLINRVANIFEHQPFVGTIV